MTSTKLTAVFSAVVLLLGGCSGGNGTHALPPSGRRSPLSVSQINVYKMANATSSQSISVTLSPSPAAGDTEVAIVFGHQPSGACATMTVPTGWTLYDSKCTSIDGETIWTLSHVAQSGDSSYQFTLASGETDYLSAVVYDLSGVNAASPVDAHEDVAFVANSTSQNTAMLTPTQDDDIAIVSFATGATVGDPTINAPYSSDAHADSAISLTTGHANLSSRAATAASAAYSTAPAYGESNIILVAPASPNQLHVYTAQNGTSGSSISIALSPSPASGNTEVAIIFGHNPGGTCLTLTAPTGWTLYDSHCTGVDGETIWTLSHTAGAADSSYMFKLTSGTDYLSAIVYDLSDVNTAAPIDAHADQAYTPSAKTQTTVSLTPTQNNDLAIASFATGWNEGDPAVASPWIADAHADSAIYLTAAHFALSAQSATSATATYTTAPPFGESNIILIAPKSQQVYPYAPTFAYMGTATNGAGGNDCAGVPCVTGSMISNLNIRYVEGNPIGSSTLNGPDICNDGVYCRAVYYQTINNMGGSNNNGAICADLDAVENASNPYSYDGGTDPGYLHSAGPTSQSNRFTSRSAASCGVNVNGTYADPKYSAGTNGLISDINSAWFNNTQGPDGDSKIYTIWDNSALVVNAPEYSGGSAFSISEANAYMSDYYALFANFSYPQGFNALGSEGGYCDVVHHAYQPGCFNCDGNFQCNNPQALCSHNATGEFKFVQAERDLFSGAYPDSTYWMQELADSIDTAAYYQNAPNCKGIIDIVPLNPTWDGTSSATQQQLMLMQMLALRILLTPGGYAGAQNDVGPVMERYLPCSGCVNMVSVFPQDGLQFVPKDSGASEFVAGSGGDGNGCTAGDSGGAATFKVYCDSAHDDNSLTHTSGAVYARAGTCYKFGASIGTCVLLANEADGVEPIQDSWCTIDGLTGGCSFYARYWKPVGSGPETCYEDQGTNLGTSSASCNSGDQICPAANGCESAWGEAAWGGTATLTGVSTVNALGTCPGPLDDGGTGTMPTRMTEQCEVLLLSQ